MKDALRSRLHIAYRIAYESFTPSMMRKLPRGLQDRMALTFGWTLTDDFLSPNDWLLGLFRTPNGQPAKMSRVQFCASAGGYSAAKFRTFKWWRDSVARLWRGETRTGEQNKRLASLTNTPTVRNPGGVFPDHFRMRDQ